MELQACERARQADANRTPCMGSALRNPVERHPRLALATPLLNFGCSVEGLLMSKRTSSSHARSILEASAHAGAGIVEVECLSRVMSSTP
jgi:hypothetical protein